MLERLSEKVTDEDESSDAVGMRGRWMETSTTYGNG